MNNFNPWHDLDVGDDAPEVINAVIEIPKDSKIKYELDKESGMLKLDRFLYSAVHYPGDYGFVPKTYWEDDDPLDILILSGRPVQPMTLAEARVIGILRMVDDGEEDDKVLAVYDEDPRYKEYRDIDDVPEHIITELKHFFETYKLLQGKRCKILEILSREHALESVKKGKRLYEEKFEDNA